MLAGDLGGVAMVTDEEFSRLVAGIYAAAITPQQWEPVIRDVAGTLDATGGGLVFADGSSRWLVGAIVPPEAAQSYAEHYSRIDHVLAAIEEGPVGAVRAGGELIAAKPTTEFHAGWIRPYGLEDGLFVRLNSGTTTSCFVVASPRRSEAFDTPERVKLMSGLIPHLQQALRTHDKLAALSQHSDDLAGALDAVGHGIIVVGSGGLAIHLNTAAQRLLRAEDGLHLRSGHIAATNIHTEQELYCALHSVLIGDGSNVRSGRSFVCARPSGKRPYVIHTLPLHHSGTDETAREATALVLIIDPEHEPEPAAALLRRLHGLTNMEAQVALRIMRGADLKQVSEELSVSVTTVRTHLQHAFDKTGTHRQAELVRTLLTLSQ
jgi:DNA-binding CsgD family transcriptional regulator